MDGIYINDWGIKKNTGLWPLHDIKEFIFLSVLFLLILIANGKRFLFAWNKITERKTDIHRNGSRIEFHLIIFLLFVSRLWFHRKMQINALRIHIETAHGMAVWNNKIWKFTARKTICYNSRKIPVLFDLVQNPSLSVHSIDSAWNLNRTAHTTAMLLLCICFLFSVLKNHLHLAINRLWDFTNIVVVVVDSFYQINLSSIRSTINHFRKLIHWLLRFGPTFK